MPKKSNLFKPNSIQVGQVYRVQDGDKFAAAGDQYRTGALFEVGYVAKDGTGWDTNPHLGLLSSKLTKDDIRREYVKLLHDAYAGVTLDIYANKED
jgi:hypothetical protein